MFTLRTRAQTALTTGVILSVGGLGFLSVVASGQAHTDLGLRILQWVQDMRIPGIDGISAFANFFTDAPMAITLWVVATAFFVLRGRPLEALAIFSISGLWLANEFLGMAVNRPAPPSEISGGIEFTRAEGGSFPSGHVTGAVVFYGLLLFLTFSNVRRGYLRTSVAALAVVVIGVASLSRVYVGAHWPSDVLGSYLMGFIGVVGIAWLYTTIKEDRLHLPRLRKKQAPPTIDGITLAGSIASTVYLDSNAGTATKEYSPPWPVRALYWLAFQASFPYQNRRDALESAAAKRKIAGLLTRHWSGRDMVAPVYEIRNGGSTYGFVTELVRGSEPESNKEIEGTLSELDSHFLDAGLPTWQISPGNPHAYSNFIRTPEGELKLIDLESSIVSFSPPFRQLRSALRDGLYPVFDDVDFVRLRGYVSSHASELAGSLGSAGFGELNQAIDSAETSSLTWKQSERRIWGRLAQRIYRVLDMSRFFAGVSRRLDSGEAMARAFLGSAVDRWEREGRIDGARAAFHRDQLATSEVGELLKHLGAHAVLSLALRFPLGSMARFAWVVAFRVRARYELARGRIAKEQYAEVRSIHSVPVMLDLFVKTPRQPGARWG